MNTDKIQRATEEGRALWRRFEAAEESSAQAAVETREASKLVRSDAKVLRAVEKWKRAERRYQRDCNLRWHLKRPDEKRRELAKASSIYYQQMMNVLKVSTENTTMSRTAAEKGQPQ